MINNNLVEEVIEVTFISGVSGLCLKNKATGLVKLSVTLDSSIANGTTVGTIPVGARPSTTINGRGIVKQTTGFGRGLCGVNNLGGIVISAVDLNEPMTGHTYNLNWKV